jgi:hypothetical protein
MRRTQPSDTAQSRAHARAKRQVEILLRHYGASKSKQGVKEPEGNPIYLWAAIWQLTKWPELLGLPAEVNAYLQSVSGAVLDLAEGIDRRSAPTLPPSNATQEEIIKYFRANRAFEAKATVKYSKGIHALILRALGFVTRQGKNVFTEYRHALKEQADYDVLAIHKNRHKTKYKRGGRGSGFQDVEAEIEFRDVRTIGRWLSQAKLSVDLGNL